MSAVVRSTFVPPEYIVAVRETPSGYNTSITDAEDASLFDLDSKTERDAGYILRGMCAGLLAAHSKIKEELAANET